MKISGFTVVRNADKFYFPIKQCIESVLPVVDEFIVALGNCDEGDRTEEIIRSIGSEKVKIFHRVWDESKFKNGFILRDETTFALQQCTGDWCIYLQADELMHEKDHALIKQYCQRFLEDKEVHGFLCRYQHFFGDYNHYAKSHAWYANEIRIVKNHMGIESYWDAQSFRINGSDKMNVIQTPIRIFHYGWVRPPQIMTSKRKEQDKLHHGADMPREEVKGVDYFDYGPLGRLRWFDTKDHPAVLQEWITKMNWKDKLDMGKDYKALTRPKVLHERTKYRLISFIENYIMHRQIFGWKNWNLVRKKL
ncbi:MAG: hypothetical protein KGO81_12855 [Bacteroidota bacterium]|nr:hypothetical protein [Bacteroidota bacterium]